jgi:hypothetical protein
MPVARSLYKPFELLPLLLETCVAVSNSHQTAILKLRVYIVEKVGSFSPADPLSLAWDER